MENCCRFVFYNNIDSFDLHFCCSFSDNRAREKEKNKLRHHHVITMVYALIDQSVRKKSLSYCKYGISIYGEKTVNLP